MYVNWGEVIQKITFHAVVLMIRSSFVCLKRILKRPSLCYRGHSSWLQIQGSRVRFPALPVFLRSVGCGTGSSQSLEDNWGATPLEKERLRSRKPRLTAPWGSVALTTRHPCTADKRRALSRYSSLADWKPRSLFLCKGYINLKDMILWTGSNLWYLRFSYLWLWGFVPSAVVTSRSPLKVSRRFRPTCTLNIQVWTVYQVKHLLSRQFLVWRILLGSEGGVICSFETSVDFLQTPQRYIQEVKTLD
jgi:hypothetical protein